jgi:hypothetical protein
MDDLKTLKKLDVRETSYGLMIEVETNHAMFIYISMNIKGGWNMPVFK